MGKRKKQQFWTKKRRIIAVVAAAVVAAAVCVGILLTVVSQQKNQEPGVNEQARKAAEAAAKQAEADGKLRDEARSAVAKDNVAEAEKIYETAVAKENDDDRKVRLYLDLSAVYYAQKRYNDAIATGKKAEAASKDTFLAADWLSRLYEDQKLYKEAAAYYTMAAERATSLQNTTGLDNGYYLSKAAEMRRLGGGAS